MSERTRKGGFRGFRIVEKVRESSIITSFLLEPVDSDGWLPFEAGQFLVLRIPEDGARRAVPRSYSVSSSPYLEGRYRLTIKRETAPAPDVPDGVGSLWLHDRVDIGDVIQASGPRGEFFLDRTSPRPVVLLSGGVGLTPMVSMLHALRRDAHREVHFIHACDHGDVHALRDEVMDVAANRPGMTVHFCYRFPTDSDRSAARFQSEGLLSASVLDALLPPADRDYYLCGPPPFMKAVYGLLRARGVPKDRIAFEFFGPATVLEDDVKAADPAKPTPSATAPAQPTSVAAAVEKQVVEFRRTGRKVPWDGTAPSLLDFAEAIGLAPPFSCRAGVCSTCKTALVSGEVIYTEDPLEPTGPGHVLLCCAKPKGSIVLDL